MTLRRRPLRLELSTPAARAVPSPRAGAATRALFERDRGAVHWAHDYAQRLTDRVPPGRPVLIQTSMSPSGWFHVGNFRDTVTAHLVARAVRMRGRDARVLLSFDDFDAVRGAGRPLADTPRSQEICHAYVADLRAVGLWPQWQMHHQADRYRAGTYLGLQRRLVRDRARLAALLGAGDADRLFTPYCAQCARNTTVLERLTPRRLEYRCRSCGASVSTDDLRELKPSWAVDWMLRIEHEGIDCEPAGPDHCVAGSTMDRTRPVFGRLVERPQPVIVPYGCVRQFREPGKISGSRGGGLRVADLLAVLPARLVLWLYGRIDCRADLRISLDLATLARWYADYDAFRAAAVHDRRAGALWALLADEPDPDPAPAPGFRRVAGAVQSQLFDLPAAERALRSAGFRDAGQDTLRERLVLARNWLGTWGRDRCWLPAEPEAYGGPPPEPLTAADLVHQPAPERYHATAWALFGTRTAPPLSLVVERLGARAVADALAAFRARGERPLRAELERRMASREAVAWA